MIWTFMLGLFLGAFFSFVVVANLLPSPSISSEVERQRPEDSQDPA